MSVYLPAESPKLGGGSVRRGSAPTLRRCVTGTESYNNQIPRVVLNIPTAGWPAL